MLVLALERDVTAVLVGSIVIYIPPTGVRKTRLAFLGNEGVSIERLDLRRIDGDHLRTLSDPEFDLSHLFSTHRRVASTSEGSAVDAAASYARRPTVETLDGLRRAVYRLTVAQLSEQNGDLAAVAELAADLIEALTRNAGTDDAQAPMRLLHRLAETVDQLRGRSDA